MKKILFLPVIVLCWWVACKKPPIDPGIHLPYPPAYMDSVVAFLRVNTSNADYESIDLSRCVLSKQGQQWFWKFPLKGKVASSDFLLLQSDSSLHFTRGKWISLKGLSVDHGLVNGSIRIVSLDGSNEIVSGISGGYIEALHPERFSNALKTESHPDPYEPLQEVIVVAYRPSANYSPSINTYMLLQALMGDSGGGGFYEAATYTSTSGGSGAGQPADQMQDAAGITPANDISLNIEKAPYLPAIDIAAWLKCFDAIPDEGASFSLTLCGDLPVDDDPSISVNLYTGATGHCFLQLQKTNGAQSITQVIGFTAQNALGALANADAFVPSKLVDNASHKYDCSITMEVNAGAFTTVMEKMKELAALPYSITRFDCLDYDLAVLNTVRGNHPLVLPNLSLTANGYTQISTGERLFELLQSMKDQADPESPNIFTGGPVFAGNSHGPCN